jgi:hypothetical protein
MTVDIKATGNITAVLIVVTKATVNTIVALNVAIKVMGNIIAPTKKVVTNLRARASPAISAIPVQANVGIKVTENIIAGTAAVIRAMASTTVRVTNKNEPFSKSIADFCWRVCLYRQGYCGRMQ